MKNYLNQIKAVVILAAVVAAVLIFNFARASSSYVPSNPPQSNPAPFLDISSTAQAKQGWLALGAPSSSYNPMAVLDVQGTAIADVLGVLGSGWVSGNLEVGGTNPPVLTNPALVVEGSRIRSSVLAGTGDRPVCADSNGLLTLCATTAVNGTCDPAGEVSTSSAPTTNLCNSGTPSAVTGTGPWSWTCAGLNGGNQATCNAPVRTSIGPDACGAQPSSIVNLGQSYAGGCPAGGTSTPILGIRMCPVQSSPSQPPVTGGYQWAWWDCQYSSSARTAYYNTYHNYPQDLFGNNLTDWQSSNGTAYITCYSNVCTQ